MTYSTNKSTSLGVEYKEKKNKNINAIWYMFYGEVGEVLSYLPRFN
jgi:hypothetical protein